MEVELRDYTIRHGEMDEWIARWKASVVPLREAAGFHIVGAWVDRQNDRFVWLLGYDGADGFDAANGRYYASPGRTSVRPEPAELIDVAREVRVETIV
jgi:NIPSNAP